MEKQKEPWTKPLYWRKVGVPGTDGTYFCLSVCPICSATVVSEKKHEEWHEGEVGVHSRSTT